MTPRRDLPTFPGAVARLFPTGGTGLDDPTWRVILASDPDHATPSHVGRLMTFAAFVEHSPGCTFPDDAGCRQARTALAEGEPAVLIFANLGDALACKRRLDAEAGQ